MFATILTFILGWKRYPVHSDSTNGTIFVPRWWGPRRQRAAVDAVMEPSEYLPGWDNELPPSGTERFEVTIWEYPEVEEDDDYGDQT